MLLNMKYKYENLFSWMRNSYIDYAMNFKIWRMHSHGSGTSLPFY